MLNMNFNISLKWPVPRSRCLPQTEEALAGHIKRALFGCPRFGGAIGKQNSVRLRKKPEVTAAKGNQFNRAFGRGGRAGLDPKNLELPS